MSGRTACVVLLIGLAVGVGGCEAPRRTIPPGAEVVHLTITEDGVIALNPPTARGDVVYLMLDEPAGGSFVLIGSKRSVDAPDGPLTDADLARVARGDAEFTSMSGHGGGCDPGQREAARGFIGVCGNVFEFHLEPGKYALAVEPPEAGRHIPITVLEVLP